MTPPPWYLYFLVVVELACLNEPESHAGANTLPPMPDGVKGDRSDQKRYPGPAGWGLGHEADLISVKKHKLLGNLG
jgi:hypothetical protein